MNPIVARYVDTCAALLRKPCGAPVRTWLHRRGITDTTIDANRLGADPGRAVLMRRRGLPYGKAIAATFPALDPAGTVTYVQARYLDVATVGRKYDNPSAHLAPHPRLAFAARTGQRSGLLVVCEGIPDALVASQSGYAAVGLLGAHAPDEAVALQLAAHASNDDLKIALICDPDDAGARVAHVLVPLLERQGVTPIVAVPPGGADLNEWALTDPDWGVQLDRLSFDHGATDEIEIGSASRSVGVEL